ncbi:MAG TPA: hypothetical protein VN915_15055 [Elusimicrobiota bacterium]|nr:hypothetical protein [Elusimicrobiota bacterium]
MPRVQASSVQDSASSSAPVSAVRARPASSGSSSHQRTQARAAARIARSSRAYSSSC